MSGPEAVESLDLPPEFEDTRMIGDAPAVDAQQQQTVLQPLTGMIVPSSADSLPGEQIERSEQYYQDGPGFPSGRGTDRMEATQQTGPSIQVTIERVEVHADSKAPPASPRRVRSRYAPPMSLGDYLKKRNGGG